MTITAAAALILTCIVLAKVSAGLASLAGTLIGRRIEAKAEASRRACRDARNTAYCRSRRI